MAFFLKLDQSHHVHLKTSFVVVVVFAFHIAYLTMIYTRYPCSVDRNFTSTNINTPTRDFNQNV